MKLVTTFKSLGDRVRLRLFTLLAHSGELCVCHLTDALQLPQSTVSRHLALLRQAGLLTTRRDGKWMYYQLSTDIPDELLTLILSNNNADIAADAVRLKLGGSC